ncbi:hypothetical protein GJAV_G00052380 [Gymnothorax javanicus]|nr:hypothetical protein GJAV_G00052380 [Gymnothorax javanicus]
MVFLLVGLKPDQHSKLYSTATISWLKCLLMIIIVVMVGFFFFFGFLFLKHTCLFSQLKRILRCKFFTSNSDNAEKKKVFNENEEILKLKSLLYSVDQLGTLYVSSLFYFLYYISTLHLFLSCFIAKLALKWHDVNFAKVFRDTGKDYVAKVYPGIISYLFCPAFMLPSFFVHDFFCKFDFSPCSQVGVMPF